MTTDEIVARVRQDVAIFAEAILMYRESLLACNAGNMALAQRIAAISMQRRVAAIEVLCGYKMDDAQGLAVLKALYDDFEQAIEADAECMALEDRYLAIVNGARAN